MNNKSEVRVYNLLLPIWMIVFMPTWLWLILIPANYIIDRIVLRWSLGDYEDRDLFCRKHTWKICIAGFLSDFVGAFLMLAFTLLLSQFSGNAFLEDAAGGVMMNPFTNALSLIITLLGIALAAFCIRHLDEIVLTKSGLDAVQAKKASLRLALITAPYVYLIPSQILYSSGL